nr:rac GTPase-activating protein 1-like [Leptinotarsa decemlineata]
MSDALVEPFKTPLSALHVARCTSDSEESSASDYGSSTGGSNGELTIVALYDEYKRLIDQKLEDKFRMVESYLNFAEETKLMHLELKKALTECQRLQNVLNDKVLENTELQKSLCNARGLLDAEKKKRKHVEQELESLEHKIGAFCNELTRDQRNKIADETREQIRNLHSGRLIWSDLDRLSAIREVNTTGSILSDFSFSRSEDDLDSSRSLRPGREWNKRQPTSDKNEPAKKKRRSGSNKVVEIGESETVKATTTLTLSKNGPITATSIIESVPKTEEANLAPPNLVFESWARQENNYNTPNQERNNILRQHCFMQKTVVMPENCSACEKRVRFGRSAIKCKECKSLCHIECKDLLPLPCVPVMNTPSSKKVTGTIADYTPMTPPMVPSLIIHCVTEVELRGLNELGIYRIPGSERDVKGLKEKFLTGRTTPSVKELDIHVICGCIKDFLRLLKEPLITYARWNDFIQAVRAKDPQDIEPALYEIISQLPQPNRDTLAYMILHLKKVSESPECKMPSTNLAKVFAPTIVGYSSDEPDPNKLIEETKLIMKVMSHLIDLPSDYWSSFVNVSSVPSSGKLQQTPSTDSLLRPTSHRIFTSGSRSELSRFKRKREGRVFNTPPTYK